MIAACDAVALEKSRGAVPEKEKRPEHDTYHMDERKAEIRILNPRQRQRQPQRPRRQRRRRTESHSELELRRCGSHAFWASQPRCASTNPNPNFPTLTLARSVRPYMHIFLPTNR